MIRIRFHGRGGHGVKTASRIVGTAAFLAGYHAQDSPVYGAERRGAPVVSFTRIDNIPVLERGIITQPDYIICGDDTLLESPETGVLQGVKTASGIFINTENLDALQKKVDVGMHAVGLDVTKRTLEHLGSASALSTGLGVVAARLIGIITWDHLYLAVRQELEELGLDSQVIEKNLTLAKDMFEAVEAIPLCAADATVEDQIHHVGYDDVVVGTPSILAPGNAEARKTGAWRVERPEIDYDRCTRCGLCFVHCPDGAIALDEQGYPIIDYGHCKGCMICLEQCRPHAIKSKKEVRSW